VSESIWAYEKNRKLWKVIYCIKEDGMGRNKRGILNEI